ncbi:MAG: aldolase/citrate lyase family protein, partial [Anaerolineales bacterium]
VCFAAHISCTDPTITEALCSVADVVWVDMEHNALSLETVQAHFIATKGSDTAVLVRVPWNDPVLIKPILDMGADGIIVPMVRSAEEVRRAVAACRYPPEGIRGFGPRRASGFGRLGGPDYCHLANESLIVCCQIEHIDAVNDLDAILAVPGLTTLLMGPQDLAGSMGHMGQPTHPEVTAAMETVLAKARPAGIPVSIALGSDPAVLASWIRRGVQWITLGGDISFMLLAANQIASQLREQLRQPAEGDMAHEAL